MNPTRSVLILSALALAAAAGLAQAGDHNQTQTTPAAPSESPKTGLGQYKVQIIPPRNGRSSATDNIDTAEADLLTAPAVEANLPAIVPSGRKVIGLVLEGGGAMGLAHIGVLAWLEEHHIPVDRLTGTSMGALVGALYASGHSIAEMKAIASGDALDKVFTISTPYTDVSYRRRQDRRDLPQAFQFGLKGGLGLRNSLLTDNALDAFLRVQFEAYNSHSVDYDQLPIPFRCVATDLNELKPLIFRGGPLPSAIRASISIPGVFPPVDYHHHYLVDGAIMDNLPIDVVKRDLRADVIIAVHLPNTEFAEGDIGSIVGVFARAFSAGTQHNVDGSMQSADVLLLPGTDKFSTMDYDKAQALSEAGYASAEAQRAKLIGYALSDADWASYVSAREGRKRVKPGILQVLHVETLEAGPGSAGAERRVAIDLAPLREKPIDPNKISGALSRVQGNGSFEAMFETFSDTSHPLSPISTQDTGVLVRLNAVRNGPPFLLLGADLTAANGNVTRSGYDFRIIDQNLGGFGSELRADLRLGYLTQTSFEYYRLLSSSGWFVQPRLNGLREPVYIWNNQVRTAEYFEQMAGGGLDVGRTFNRNKQIALEYRSRDVRWHLTSGLLSSAEVSGTANTAMAHLVYDSTVSGTVSPHGYRFDLSAGALFNTVDSHRAPMMQLRMGKSFTFREKNLFGLSADVDTYFRHQVTEPLRFTLGGPYRLSASSFDEYRGTDTYLVRGGYLRRLASLPTGLGQGVYAFSAYEAGETWSPERPAFLRQDVLGGVLLDTPLGVVTFGGSIGDAGRRKILLSIGKLF